MLTSVLCSLSDSEGGGNAAEELHAQLWADGGAPPLPVWYDQALQQQQREQKVCGYTHIRDIFSLSVREMCSRGNLWFFFIKTIPVVSKTSHIESLFNTNLIRRKTSMHLFTNFTFPRAAVSRWSRNTQRQSELAGQISMSSTIPAKQLFNQKMFNQTFDNGSVEMFDLLLNHCCFLNQAWAVHKEKFF